MEIGNAFKNINISRLDKCIYIIIMNKIITEFSKLLNIGKLYNFYSKTSFENIDLLYNIRDKNDDRSIKHIILEICKSDYIIINGSITTFIYVYNENNYQVNFIKSNNFPMSQLYLSYGMTGYIIGLMTRRNNIIFGPDGIELQIYGSMLNTVSNNILNCNEIQIYDTIKLVDDPREICDFFGFSYETWLLGFDMKEDLYHWICSSQLYSIKYYSGKIIDERLFDFKKYIDYNLCNNIGIDFYSDLCLNYFDKTVQLLVLIEKLKGVQEIKDKFDAYIILNKAITGTNIDKCMKFIRDKHEDFDLWVKDNDKEYIHKICNIYIDEYISL